jgi:hypothetical protein
MPQERSTDTPFRWLITSWRETKLLDLFLLQILYRAN